MTAKRKRQRCADCREKGTRFNKDGLCGPCVRWAADFQRFQEGSSNLIAHLHKRFKTDPSFSLGNPEIDALVKRRSEELMQEWAEAATKLPDARGVH